MAIKVVDASALGAILFKEPEREGIARRLEGARLIAPALLEFEITNACVSKMRRHPESRAGILLSFELRSELAIEVAEIDFIEVLHLAKETGLTGYDASYLWLARRQNAELVTLDRALDRAAAGVVPGA
jgi:predicted nucleic acid-binding protein